MAFCDFVFARRLETSKSIVRAFDTLGLVSSKQRHIVKYM